MKFLTDDTTKKLFGVAIFLLAALVVISMVSSQMGLVDKQLESAQDAKKDMKKPTVSFRTQSEKEIYGVGDTIDVIVSADSKGEAITAFDLILDYNHSVLEYIEARPLISSYDVILPKSDTKIAIIGSQKVTVEEAQQFKDTALVLLRFKALEEGDSEMDFVFTPNSDTETNLFTVQNIDIVKEVKIQPVRVGKTTTMTKGAPIEISSDISATLESFLAPPSDCFDCMASATIVVQKGKISKKIEFTAGGIGGRLPEPVAFGGYIFDLVDITANSVIIAYVSTQ